MYHQIDLFSLQYVSTLGGAKDSVAIGSARAPLYVKTDDIGGPLIGFYRVLGFEGKNRNNTLLGIGIGASVGPNPEDPEYESGDYAYSNTVLGPYMQEFLLLRHRQE